MERDARIRCESCQGRWDAPGTMTGSYLQRELETRPCPSCGACTLVLSVPERARRRGPTVRSFVVPKRLAAV